MKAIIIFAVAYAEFIAIIILLFTVSAYKSLWKDAWRENRKLKQQIRVHGRHRD